MAVIERGVVLQGMDEDGNPTIDLPVTRLGNIESTAEIKTVPAEGDYIPIIDSEDGEKMKKAPWREIVSGGGIYTVDLSQYGIDIWDMVDQMTDEGLRRYEAKTSDSYNFANVYGLELADGVEQTVVFVFPNFTYSIPVDKNYSMADVIRKLGMGPLGWYNYTMTYDVASGRLAVFGGDGREVAIKVTANDAELTPTPPGNNHLPLLREITSGVYSGKQTYILLSDEDRGNHICPVDEGIISGTSPYIVWFNFTEGNLSGTLGQWRSFRAGIGVDSVCLDELTPGGSAQSE